MPRYKYTVLDSSRTVMAERAHELQRVGALRQAHEGKSAVKVSERERARGVG